MNRLSDSELDENLDRLTHYLIGESPMWYHHKYPWEFFAWVKRIVYDRKDGMYLRDEWGEWLELVCEYWRRNNMIPEPVTPGLVGDLLACYQTCGQIFSPNWREHRRTVPYCIVYGCRNTGSFAWNLIRVSPSLIDDARTGDTVHWCETHLDEAIRSGLVAGSLKTRDSTERPAHPT